MGLLHNNNNKKRSSVETSDMKLQELTARTQSSHLGSKGCDNTVVINNKRRKK